MSISYGTKGVSPGVPTIYNVPANIGWAVIQNESPYTITCTIDGTGSSRSLPAQAIDKVTIPAQGFNGNIILLPEIVLTNSANAPSFAVILDAYGQFEEPTGAYPVALSRTVQVGGTVDTVTSLSNELQNRDNVANTTIIDVKPVDAASNTWSGDNEGNLTIKSNNAGTLTTLLQLIAGASPAVKLAAAAVLTEVLGDLQVDGSQINFLDSGSVSRIVLNLDGSDNTLLSSQKDVQIVAGSTQSIFTKIAAANITKTTTAGIQCLTGGYKGPTGDVFARVGSFSGTGSGTVSHSLGATPDWAGITVHQSASSATVGYFSETTTQITVTLGASLSYFGFCTKRT